MVRWTLVLAVAACGAPMAGGAGGGTAAVGGGGTCCLNGSFYDCRSKAAFDACAGPDPSACHDGCGADGQCHAKCDMDLAQAAHDPSACTRDASKDATCSTGGTSGVCLGTKGVACSYSTQCSSGNCTDGHCYARAVGNPCSYSTQCDSNNCTNGCCSGNSKGSACSYSTQCTSSNCTGGKCQ